MAVAACVGTTITSGTWLADRISGALNQANRIPGITNNQPPTDGNLKPGQTRPAATGAAAVTIADTADTAVISATVTAGKTEVSALPGNGGAATWTVAIPIEPADLTLTTIDTPAPGDDLVIVDGKDSATDAGKPVRAVLNATSGKLLWKATWTNRYDVAHYGTNAIIETRGSIDGNAVTSIDLRTGKQRWNRPGNSDLLIIDSHRIEALRQWPAATVDPTAGTLPAVKGALRDTITTSPTVIELNTSTGKGFALDATTGKLKSSGNLPLDEDRWVAYDNLVIGKLSDEASPARDVLAAYNVADLKQKWKLELPAGVDIENVKPCGPQLICAAINETRNNRVIALDTRTGKQTWSTPTESAGDENWYTTATMLVCGDGTFDRISEARVLGQNDGKQLRQLPQFTNVTATDGTNMVLQSYNGTTEQWQVAVQEITSGRTTSGADVGPEPPEHVTIHKDLVAVLTADRRALTFKITDLAQPAK